MSVDDWIQKEGWYVHHAGKWVLEADVIKDKFLEMQKEIDDLEEELEQLEQRFL